MATKLITRGRPFTKGNGGRPKGATGRIARTVKEMVLDQINAMNNDPGNKAYKYRLENFAARYPREFYAMAARLIPTEITAKLTKIELTVVRTTHDLPEIPTSESEGDNQYGQTV